MKICFVTVDTNPHIGLGRVVCALSDELSRRGHTVGIITSKGESVYPMICIPLSVHKKQPVRLFKNLLAIRRFVSNYDVVVVFDPRPVGIIVHAACLGLRTKIIMQTLGTYALFESHNFFKNLLIAFTYKHSYKVFVINDFVKRCIESSKKNFSFGSNMSIVPVGVDIKLFHEVAHPSYVFGESYILSVGAIKPRKGQLKSVEAFCAIADEFPKLQYVIVGDIEENHEYIGLIRKCITDAHLEHRVHMQEKISDEKLIDLYSGAEFFILTPTTTKEFIEGFGMVYLEAALCGATAIGTRNTGAEAAIEDKKSGLLVDEDVESIVEAMRLLLSSASVKTEYKQYAKERALLYDWSHIADLYEKELMDIK